MEAMDPTLTPEQTTPEQTVLGVMRSRKKRGGELARDSTLRNGSVGEGVLSNGMTDLAGYTMIEPEGIGMGVMGTRTSSMNVNSEYELTWEMAQIKAVLQFLQGEVRENHAKSSQRISELEQKVLDLKQPQQAIPPGQGQTQVPVYVQAQAPASGQEQIAAQAEKISNLARDVEELKRQQWQQREELHSTQQIRKKEKEEEEQENKKLQERKQQDWHEVQPSSADLDHHLSSHTTGTSFTEKPLTKARLAHFTRGYSVEESMWDSSIFIGFPATGRVTSIVIVLGILLTIAMEGSFVLVVYANYRYHELTDDMLDGLLHWRAVVAHDVRNYDPASYTSLASRVCMQEMSTDRSTLQFDTFINFHEFRNSSISGLSVLNGYYLCHLALILWFFAIVHDIILNVRFTCSVLAHRQGRAVIVEKGEEFWIESFNRLQVFVVINLVTIPRLAISLFLGFAGLFFIAHTSTLNELLLNAVALVFVLDIDEMLFYALLPQRAKHLTREVANLIDNDEPGVRTKVLTWVRAVAEELWIRLLGVGMLLVLCDFWVMQPFNDKLDLALKYICDGDTDFLYSTNQVNDIVFYANVPVFDYEQSHRMTYHKRAVLEIIGMDRSLFDDKLGNLPDAVNYQNSAVKIDVHSLKRQAFGSRLYVSSTSVCIDHTDLKNLQKIFPGDSLAQEYYQSTELLLRDKLARPDFESCSELDFNFFCLSGTSGKLRSLCAKTCGCDNPWSGQFFAVPVAGCSLNCNPRWQLNLFYNTPAHIAKYTDICEDVPVGVLKEDKSWKRYTLGLMNYLFKFEPQNVVNAQYDQLQQMGCNYLTELRFHIDLCNPSDNLFRSARYYCPATCMCAVSDMQECPNSCRYSPPHQIMSQGIPCPIGLEIASRLECTTAANAVLNRVMPISLTTVTVPEGCYVSHGELIYASGPRNLTVPFDYLSLCKSPQPFLPNSIAKGEFTLGKHCADCILYNEPCAQECYSASPM